ncbi:MAG: ankyrin repeat domain-containing protein [bacterium]|nr:ankyrin repeat domain-containing protein [bacterium]
MFDSAKKFIQAVKDNDEKTATRYVKEYYYNSRKVDLNTRDGTGMTALAHAAKLGHTNIVATMMKFGVEANTPDKEGHTPLTLSLINKHREIAKILITRGADVNAHAADYITPLHFAAHQGDIELVKMLVSNSANLDTAIINNGYTPLHWAIIQGHANVVEFLVQSGARTDMPDKKGQTQLEIATAKGAHMQKILETPVVQAAPAAAVEEEPAAPAYSNNDRWLRTGEHQVTHIGDIPDINRRLTEIFNFETRERSVIHENTRSGAETTMPPESFDTIAEAALRKALAEFVKLGGDAVESDVIGKRGNSGTNAGPSKPFRV